MSENTINIYMGEEDKVNVKDATQIIKLQGPKGEPGPKGGDGVQGPKGEPFKFSDFTTEQLELLKGPKGDKGDSGPQGDNVNLETVAKIKNILLENNVMVYGNSLEGIMLDYFKLCVLSSGSVSFIKDNSLFVPVVEINDNVLLISYTIGLPFQINDGPIEYVDSMNKEIPITSSGPITVKFYNARMELMFTKTVQAQ